MIYKIFERTYFYHSTGCAADVDEYETEYEDFAEAQARLNAYKYQDHNSSLRLQHRGCLTSEYWIVPLQDLDL